MDIGFYLYTHLSSQAVVELKPCIPLTATHLVLVHTHPKTKQTLQQRFENDSKHEKMQVCFFVFSSLFQKKTSLHFFVISFLFLFTSPWRRPVILLILFYLLVSLALVFYCHFTSIFIWMPDKPDKVRGWEMDETHRRLIWKDTTRRGEMEQSVKCNITSSGWF